MNRSRIKPLVWGSWPPGPRPSEKYCPADNTCPTAPETLEQPAPDQAAPQDMAAPATPKAAPEALDCPPDRAVDPTSAEMAEETSGESSMADQAPDGAVKAAESGTESQFIAIPRPPAPNVWPYYPPGPPTGPVSPGAPNAPDVPPGPVYPGYELARAYIPIQRFGQTYSLPEALEKGTLFPELWRPYPR